jgi:RHS repeat-associated protein
MTSDGTNAFAWDADNRMIKITYPGTNNFSSFVYDGWGKCVNISEYSNAILTNTKQFIWANGHMCDSRDASGNLQSQYFAYGQLTSSIKYFYTTDHSASVREMCDSTGILRAQYTYTPFGTASRIQGSIDSDFLYDIYYAHNRSGLLLTRWRQYLPTIGRWLSREPRGSGQNLFAYVENDPINYHDPSGLKKQIHGNWCGGGYTNGDETTGEGNPNVVRDSRCGNAEFKPPVDALDWCCWMHDLCMHWSHGIEDKGARNNQGRCCDNKLADCATNAGSASFNNLFSGLGTGKFGPHGIAGTAPVPGIPSNGVFNQGMWIPPSKFPPDNLIDPFDPNQNPQDPSAGCGHSN